MSIKKHINIMEKNKDFKSQEDVFAFEKAAFDLVQELEEESIPIIVQYLDDECDYPEVMYSLIHSIEEVDSAPYVKKIVHIADFLFEKAPEFSETIFYGILNHEESLTYLKQEIQNSDSLAKVTPILERIIKNSKDHEAICRELLNSGTTA